MESILTEKTYQGKFTIDFSKINQCKGVLSIEVKPKKRLDTLVLNNVPSDTISHKSPFKLEAKYPLTNGELTFNPYKSSNDMKSVVRMVLLK